MMRWFLDYAPFFLALVCVINFTLGFVNALGVAGDLTRYLVATGFLQLALAAVVLISEGIRLAIRDAER